MASKRSRKRSASRQRLLRGLHESLPENEGCQKTRGARKRGVPENEGCLRSSRHFPIFACMWEFLLSGEFCVFQGELIELIPLFSTVQSYFIAILGVIIVPVVAKLLEQFQLPLRKLILYRNPSIRDAPWFHLR